MAKHLICMQVISVTNSMHIKGKVMHIKPWQVVQLMPVQFTHCFTAARSKAGTEQTVLLPLLTCCCSVFIVGW